MSTPLHPATHIGAVHLTVRDLERSLAFYQERLGLRLNGREGGAARLGVPGRDLLVLVENPAARPARGTTGLYHFALLVPSRLDLARSFARLVGTRTSMTGASDHGVSEALYLSDPDLNGIEIYRDREQQEWPWQGDRLAMTTEALDLEALLSELERAGPAAEGLAAATRIGHVHLHVGDLAPAGHFYLETLGMDLMQRYGPSALFVSAGGYHHHVGLNTWQGVGAPPPPADATGLRYFEILVPNEAELDRVGQRLGAMGVPSEKQQNGVFLRDPANNGILLRVDDDAGAETTAPTAPPSLGASRRHM
jgi:catechol 2,3-dioxygenase